MPKGGRRLAAIMFTDMVGYTALGQRNESLSLALVEEQRKLIRPILNRHNGDEVKTIGDAFLVKFPNALDAVRCAYDIQRAAREFNISMPEDRRIHLRVGVHVGDIVESGGDISGDAVNVASRIESPADDGSVLLTRQVYDHVRNKFELPLEALGARALKNVSTPVEIYKMIMPWEGEVPVRSKKLDKRRVAVLPFANMSPDPNDSYFADGITEEIIAIASTVSGLSVTSRTSVMGYKGTRKKVKEIGRELDVGSVLEGSFRKAGSRIRVTTQLIDVNDDGHLWAQSYDRDLDDIFAVQTDIARQVADALRVRVLPAEQVDIDKQPTLNGEAHEFYLKGRYYWNQRTKESLSKATEYFERAVKKDPNFALGFAGLADCYYILAHNGHVEPGPATAKAKEYLGKALEMDDRLAEAHATLASILFDTDYQGGAAEAEFKKAIQLKPNYATAHQWYAIRLMILGRMDESLAEFKKALDLDPLSPAINNNLGDYYCNVKQYDKAIDQYKKNIELFPDYPGARLMLAEPYMAKSMFHEALKTLDDYQRLAGEELEVKARKATVYAWMGKEAEARRLLTEVERRAQSESIYNYSIAIAHFALGDDDEGFKWLERMYESHSPQMKFIVFDRELDHVRNDKRYLSLLSKIGLSAPLATPLV